MSLWILYVGVFRFKGGWVGIPPFFLRAALPTLLSLRSPTQTLGYLHGYSGSKTPENIAQKAVQCLLLGGDAKTWFCIPGSKHVTCRLCPDFASNQTATKKRGWHRFHCWTFVLFHLVGLQNFHFVQMDICAQWQRLFHVFRWRAFCVSDVSVWRLITVLWYTGYRYNTYTWYVI